MAHCGAVADECHAVYESITSLREKYAYLSLGTFSLQRELVWVEADSQQAVDDGAGFTFIRARAP